MSEWLQFNGLILLVSFHRVKKAREILILSNRRMDNVICDSTKTKHVCLYRLAWKNLWLMAFTNKPTNSQRTLPSVYTTCEIVRWCTRSAIRRLDYQLLFGKGARDQTRESGGNRACTIRSTFQHKVAALARTMWSVQRLSIFRSRCKTKREKRVQGSNLVQYPWYSNSIITLHCKHAIVESIMIIIINSSKTKIDLASK